MVLTPSRAFDSVTTVDKSVQYPLREACEWIPHVVYRQRVVCTWLMSAVLSMPGTLRELNRDRDDGALLVHNEAVIFA
jgi:hypothetical protein